MSEILRILYHSTIEGHANDSETFCMAQLLLPIKEQRAAEERAEEEEHEKKLFRLDEAV